MHLAFITYWIDRYLDKDICRYMDVKSVSIYQGLDTYEIDRYLDQDRW